MKCWETGYKLSGTGDQNYCSENKKHLRWGTSEGHLTLDVRSDSEALNIDLMAISG
jgi:hypothetical protein